jgi:predicted protein tyrosine phosphatase
VAKDEWPILLNEPELVVRASFEGPDDELVLLVGSPNSSVNCISPSAKKKVAGVPGVEIVSAKTPKVLEVTLVRDERRTHKDLADIAERIYTKLLSPKYKPLFPRNPLDDIL